MQIELQIMSCKGNFKHRIDSKRELEILIANIFGFKVLKQILNFAQDLICKKDLSSLISILTISYSF